MFTGMQLKHMSEYIVV